MHGNIKEKDKENVCESGVILFFKSYKLATLLGRKNVLYSKWQVYC